MSRVENEIKTGIQQENLVSDYTGRSVFQIRLSNS